MKEICTCIGIGLVGHLLVFQSVVVDILFHNLLGWIFIGCILALCSYVSNCLTGLKRTMLRVPSQ